ncbi:MAG: PQQ-dependent sugar dehydrogenase [Planctomycetes bacterium]|nr:PQQ-dependent sugar dehydrogenase [Planctomycetota bacterium]MCB9904051.1 PQQ-dependent sugar dehydrogenase [Planctomycetota bacterium]
MTNMHSTGHRTRARRGRIAWLAACALTTTAATTSAQDLRTEFFVSGINSPISMRQPAGESRIFVLSESRGIYIVENGVLNPNLFLDLSQEVAGASERVLGMEFHPDYVNNGRFWVSYMDALDQSHVVEYLRDANDPNVADESTAVHLFGPTQQPSNIHNWYDMHFGPDGMLYLAFGDGGGANDPNENAQDMSVTFGKILRVDVDTGTRGTYVIPPDNPFANLPGIAGEIWHSGVRSPWRFSFDRATGDFWLGDVGQAAWEEINFAPAGVSGLNFGWRCMEATHCTGLMNCGCGSPAWTDPVVEFPHTEARCAVMGGYVYRGSDIPWLQGTYFYADYCSARVWSFRYDGANVSEFTERSNQLAPTNGSIGPILGFGEDAAGELYILDRGGGEIWKIRPAFCDPGVNYCPSSPNSAGSGALITTGGCRSVAMNNLVLSVSGAPANQFGIFFYGPQQTAVPFGQGTLCVTGSNGVFRLKPAILTSPGGTASRALDLTVQPANGGPGGITAGSSWNFQFWYRDPGFGFNLSDAVWVHFEP